MKVAFVNANCREGSSRDRELDFYTHKCSLELGPYYLDANAGWRSGDSVRHFNIMRERHLGRDWRDEFLDFRPEVAAISGLTYYASVLHDTARWIKENVGSTVIVGGPHVTSVKHEILRDENIDYAVYGEGERAFRLFIAMLRGEDVGPASIPGLIYRQNGTICRNLQTTIDDINDLEYPTGDHVDPASYAGFTTQLNLKLLHVPILTTRGCPFRCVFCHNIMGKKARCRSAESIIDEVKYWKRAKGIDTFYINDDIFNVDRNRLKTIARECSKEGRLRFAFPNGLRADLLDRDMVDMLVECGTFYVMIAVESGNKRVQDLIRKRLNLDKAFEAIEYLGNSGVILGSYNIIGFPTETEAEIRDTIEFNVATSGLSKACFFILNPHPGTDVYQMALDEGYSPRHEYTQGYFNPSASSPTRHVSIDRLLALRQEAYRQFYLTERRLKKVLEMANPNLPAEKVREFFQVDYSYVMKQILDINHISDIGEQSVADCLRRLLPQGLLEEY